MDIQALKMKMFIVIFIFTLISSPCCSRAVDEEESVVSVYTTPTAGASPPNVYGQIATNIAEKITSPIYRLFGITDTGHQTTKRPFEHIELQDEPTNKTAERDVEELSAEALNKIEKKPEKFSLFNTYLPSPTEKISSKLEAINETNNEVDSDFDDDFVLDDVEATPRGPFVYALELLGSILQLLWAGFMFIFKPSSN